MTTAFVGCESESPLEVFAYSTTCLLRNLTHDRLDFILELRDVIRTIFINFVLNRSPEMKVAKRKSRTVSGPVSPFSELLIIASGYDSPVVIFVNVFQIF